VIPAGLYATTGNALAGPAMDVATVQRTMRDHYDGGDVHVPGAMPDNERYFSVCMHADPVGTTTASMVVELHGVPSRPLMAWMALTNPCVSPYLPVFVDAPVPSELRQGEADPKSGGAWHRFKALLTEVEKDFGLRGPVVRGFWREFEDDVKDETAAFLAALPAPGPDRVRAEAAHAQAMWDRASKALAEITARVSTL
jgi:dipeptidase